MRPTPGDWRELQEAVAAVLREAGFVAEVEKVMPHVRGSAELDVYAEQSVQRHLVTLACECKHWKSAVPQAVVQTFRSVLLDTGIDAGYVVSSAGFQSGAYATAAHTNVRLVTWEEFLEIFAPGGQPLAAGLRASAEVVGGTIAFQAPGGGAFPWMAAPTIGAGHVRRSKDGTLEAFVAITASIPAIQALNDQVGFKGIDLRSTQQRLSTDPAQPTCLSGTVEFDTPDEMQGIHPVTGEKTMYPACHCKLDISAFAVLQGSRMTGRWEARTLFNGQQLPVPITGTFALHLL